MLAVNLKVGIEQRDGPHRSERSPKPSADIEAFLDSLVYAGVPHQISFRWRGYTRDPEDAFVLELAVVAGADCVVTYNKRDFPEVETLFGIKVVDALEFLELINAL